jgi:hypothetical protein
MHCRARQEFSGPLAFQFDRLTVGTQRCFKLLVVDFENNRDCAGHRDFLVPFPQFFSERKIEAQKRKQLVELHTVSKVKARRQS